jgi:hypothetical protein
MSFGLFAGWGDYSVYVSHDGTESLTPVSTANTSVYLVQFNGNPFEITPHVLNLEDLSLLSAFG